jgi:uncharacterized membrane protein YeaQ/YmgE (transglycosylase-associated protein family)
LLNRIIHKDECSKKHDARTSPHFKIVEVPSFVTGDASLADHILDFGKLMRLYNLSRGWKPVVRNYIYGHIPAQKGMWRIERGMRVTRLRADAQFKRASERPAFWEAKEGHRNVWLIAKRWVYTRQAQEERMLHLIWYVLIGLLSGLIAKSVMHVHITLLWTIVLGIIGSILGGAVSHMFLRPKNERFHPAGLIFSTLGAILVLFICYKLGIHFPVIR